MTNKNFEDGYKKLNIAQKEAVDTIDGPVMVVAGPGTGKTQVLSLRIANILIKTDTKADGVLCLTFTNSGVRAMRARLLDMIGPTATQIKISTFHSFAGNIVDEFFGVLNLEQPPTILDDAESVALVDEILENGEWAHLRPRGDSGKYFRDIKSLISILKRENISPDELLISIKSDIHKLENDESSISTRGESKGSLKKEIITKISGLERTQEIVKFYEEYESLKKTKNLCDYDDILRYALEIIANSEDVKSELCERYNYVLVDEHQDSSGIQNNILKAIWGDTELPNIFVVGDDRQLIYGFGGASIEYFEDFKTFFGKARLITLVENYRSTQSILDTADSMLASAMTLEKLKSNSKEVHKLGLVECAYPRDEIIYCAKEIQKKLDDGMDPNDCAILVPKNFQVKNAVAILRDMGIPVASNNTLTLFEVPEARTFINILKIVNNPYYSQALGEILFDPIFNIPPLSAHKFLFNIDSYKLSVNDLLANSTPSLLSNLDPITTLGQNLENYINEKNQKDVYELVQYIGEHLLLDTALDHDTLIKRVEVVRTMLHLALLVREKCQRENKQFTLQIFLDFIERLQSYNEDIPLAVFYGNHGVKVLTLHSSKGLEFDFVWIAHMEERALMHNKRQAFTLPTKVSNLIEEKDEQVVKRQLYVALTRAKRFCTFSYARKSLTGSENELAHIISELPQEIFVKKTYEEIEKEILDHNPKSYVVSNKKVKDDFSIKDLTDMVALEYIKTKVSVTMLNNFFECPWKWYFRNLLRLPDSMSESLVFGNVVHGSIEQILKDNKKKLEEIILDQIHKQNIYDEVLIKRLLNEAKNLLATWVKERLPEIEKGYVSERSVAYRDPQFPNLSFYGKIDLTERFADGSVRVTDFKTGSVKTKNDIEKRDDDGRLSGYLRQLAMYSYLINGAEKGVKVAESQLEFLEAKDNEKNSIYKTQINQEEIDLLVRDISEYDESLKSGDWVKRECHFQSYGTSKECPNCKRALIYKHLTE